MAAPEVSARQALRAATRDAHEEVDRLFGGFDLTVRADYRRFLLAHAAAFLPIEDGLTDAGAAALVDDWPVRRRGDHLRADLAALGAAVPPLDSCAPAGAAEAWGMIYVLEGSRLGGAMLARDLPPDLPRDYLAGSQPPGSWRSLLAALDKSLYEHDDRAAAIAAAVRVFDRFAGAARRFLG